MWKLRRYAPIRLARERVAGGVAGQARFVSRSRVRYDGRRTSRKGGRNMAIAVGQTAPDFTLQNQEKKEVKLSDFAGERNVVLVFYPLDWSRHARTSLRASSTKSKSLRPSMPKSSA